MTFIFTGVKKTTVRLSKNAEQIEALLKRINEENKRTKEVLDNIQHQHVHKSPKVSAEAAEAVLAEVSSLKCGEVKALATAVIPPVRTKIIEKTSTTFLDAYQIPSRAGKENDAKNNNFPASNMKNNNNNSPNNIKNTNNNNEGETPMVTYETSGEGKKVPIVIYNCNYLSQVIASVGCFSCSPPARNMTRDTDTTTKILPIWASGLF